MRAIGMLCLVACVTGCANLADLANPFAPDATANVNLEAEADFCVAEVNRFRATLNLKALRRSSNIDSFSSEAARVDTQAREPHKHFRATNGGNGVAKAENVIPWWRLSNYGSVRQITREGLQMMWDEGPGGSHYETMKGRFSEVGCGLFIENGIVTVTQDFR